MHIRWRQIRAAAAALARAGVLATCRVSGAPTGLRTDSRRGNSWRLVETFRPIDRRPSEVSNAIAGPPATGAPDQEARAKPRASPEWHARAPPDRSKAETCLPRKPAPSGRWHPIVKHKPRLRPGLRI